MNVQAVQGHPEEVYACEFLEQNHLLTASADCVFLWDTENGACLQQASGTPGPLGQGRLSAYACSGLDPMQSSGSSAAVLTLKHYIDDRSTARQMAARLRLQC